MRFFSFLDHFSIVFCEISYLRQGIHIRHTKDIHIRDTYKGYKKTTIDIHIHIRHTYKGYKNHAFQGAGNGKHTDHLFFRFGIIN